MSVLSGSTQKHRVNIGEQTSLRQEKQPHGGTLTRPNKGETANPNGRPPRLFSALAKEWKGRGIERATKERIIEVYEYLMALTIQEVFSIAGKKNEDAFTEADNDYPAVVRLAAKEMMGKRGLEILREMLDRAHGKAKQSVDTNLNVNTPNPLLLLPEKDQEAFLNKLKKASGDNGNE